MAWISHEKIGRPVILKLDLDRNRWIRFLVDSWSISCTYIQCDPLDSTSNSCSGPLSTLIRNLELHNSGFSSWLVWPCWWDGSKILHRVCWSYTFYMAADLSAFCVVPQIYFLATQVQSAVAIRCFFWFYIRGSIHGYNHYLDHSLKFLFELKATPGYSAQLLCKSCFLFFFGTFGPRPNISSHRRQNNLVNFLENCWTVMMGHF